MSLKYVAPACKSDFISRYKFYALYARSTARFFSLSFLFNVFESVTVDNN